MSRHISIFLMLWCSSTLAATLTWKDLQASIDSWFAGPVSLILTDQEKGVYAKMTNAEEKMQFIKIFWARRDPILRTRENEFKDEYYRRVQFANENYGEGHTPGWMTARGQVYILFGPPEREEKKIVPDSNRPALLWVYGKIPSDKIPKNEALLFVYRDVKWVLVPPNPDPGDTFGEVQRQFDSAFRYQTVPGLVEQAFVDVRSSNIVDEKKDYQDLLFSVESAVKFGIAEIEFDARVLESHPPQIRVAVKAATAPVYDAGERVFAEFYFKQELKRGDVLIASHEHTVSFSWTTKEFAELEEIGVTLPTVQAPSGQYDLWITVQDRISNVSETRKIAISY